MNMICLLPKCWCYYAIDILPPSKFAMSNCNTQYKFVVLFFEPFKTAQEQLQQAVSLVKCQFSFVAILDKKFTDLTNYELSKIYRLVKPFNTMCSFIEYRSIANYSIEVEQLCTFLKMIIFSGSYALRIPNCPHPFAALPGATTKQEKHVKKLNYCYF